MARRSRRPAAPAPSPATEPERPLLAELGDTGLLQSGGWIQEEYLSELSGRQGVEVYQEMGDSPLIGAVLTLIDLLLRQIGWSVSPADDSPEAKRWADFVESCLEDLEHPIGHIVGEMIPSAVLYGWSRSEILYRIRGGPQAPIRQLRSLHSDRLIGWLDFAPRSQDSLWRWVFEDDGRGDRVVAMEQRVLRSGAATAKIPESKMLAFVPRPWKRSPEGRSSARAAYRPWFLARRAEDFELVGVERALAGLPYYQIPPELLSPHADAEQRAIRALYAEKMRKLRRGALDAVVGPSEETAQGKTGYALQLLTSGGGDGAVPDTMIRREESRLLISFLSEFLVLGMEPNGTRSLADSKTQIVAMAVGALADTWAEEFTRKAIGDLMRLNGVPSALRPTLMHGDIEAPDIESLSRTLGSLVTAGLVTPSPDLERFVLSKIPDAPAPAETALPVLDLGPDQPDAGQQQAGDTPAADMALNGAQVSSALEIVAMVGRGEIPRSSGVGMLQEFFNLAPTRAERIMGAVGTTAFTPATAAPTAAPPAPAATTDPSAR